MWGLATGATVRNGALIAAFNWTRGPSFDADLDAAWIALATFAFANGALTEDFEDDFDLAAGTADAAVFSDDFSGDFSELLVTGAATAVFVSAFIAGFGMAFATAFGAVFLG